MALLVPSVGEDQMLKQALGVAAVNDLTLKLYVNDVIPGDPDTDATYTEMSTNGYSAKTLSKANWSVAQNAGAAEASYAQQEWSFTAGTPTTIYGYFVVDAVSGQLMWAERFATAYVTENTGDILRVTPKFSLQSQ